MLIALRLELSDSEKSVLFGEGIKAPRNIRWL